MRGIFQIDMISDLLDAAVSFSLENKHASVGNYIVALRSLSACSKFIYRKPASGRQNHKKLVYGEFYHLICAILCRRCLLHHVANNIPQLLNHTLFSWESVAFTMVEDVCRVRFASVVESHRTRNVGIKGTN